MQFDTRPKTFTASHIHMICHFVFRKKKSETSVLHAVKHPAPESTPLSMDAHDNASELRQEKKRSIISKLDIDPLKKIDQQETSVQLHQARDKTL